ncbi:TRM11 family SAM-dependent methyltransferase [Inconstantimicrobium mannanitabidum]|uniref:Methyltransferase n=1 Tax=Inconstantimicrobium mannanitabidum TaxID=1604901 RepID=A0ACB5R715_9CLOT|nr:DNA methyltransferase [Clostridium sp. TW13]GKX64973.1 methyltransferase [Clostridium sp. TW13]
MNKEFFYVVNYPVYEESLCRMEMRTLFGVNLTRKYFFSDKYINLSRSPFIKDMISVLYIADDISDILDRIAQDKVSYEKFKVFYIKHDKEDIDYEERIRAVRDVGYLITGTPDIHNPEVKLGISKVDGKWIFGIYARNDFKWHEHDEKPNSYSNSLSVKMARSIVNIAVGNDLNNKLVDPCCGVGTVVIEALSMNIKAVGYEINKNVSEDAKRNLKYFGYKNVIINEDMHKINDKYNVAIIDIPYGLFTPTTLADQLKIINTARRICEKLVIVTFENMNEYIIDAGFNIKDECVACKGRFKRYISLCE